MTEIKIQEQKLEIKSLLRNFKRSWKYVKKEKGRLFGCIFLSLLLCVLSVIMPILSAKLLLSLTDGLFEQLLSMAIFIACVEGIVGIFNYVYNLIFSKYLLNVNLEIQTEIVKETLKLEASELDKKSSGIFLDRLNVDTREIADVFARLGDALMDVLSNLGVLIAILVVNKIMFFYLVVTLLLLFYVENIRMKKRFAVDREKRVLGEKNTGLVGELVRGIRDIKSLNSETFFMKKSSEKLAESLNKNYEMQKIDFKYSLLNNFIKPIVSFGLIALGVLLCVNEKLLISNFLIIFMYQNKVQGLLRYLTFVIELLKRFNVSADRVFDIVDNTKFKKETFGKYHKDNLNGDVEFKNVYFSYDGKKDVLKDVSFKIKKHQTVSFVGRSGSGKSTILNLINRLYKMDDDRGEILLDGVNIKEYDKTSIRNNIAVVTQTPYIFNMTIRENLEIVCPNLSNKKMKEVCDAVSLSDFIETLPDKYDTLVGEGGLTLSGGQRQRLAIVRAILKDTEIILFDEATSALDNETQEEVRKAINNMKGNYTIIIVAHRLSTVIDSDVIHVIDNGKLVASGSHKDLMKNNDIYRKLYKKEDI